MAFTGICLRGAARTCIRLTGRNGIMDFAFWIILAVLIVIYLMMIFRRRR